MRVLFCPRRFRPFHSYNMTTNTIAPLRSALIEACGEGEAINSDDRAELIALADRIEIVQGRTITVSLETAAIIRKLLAAKLQPAPQWHPKFDVMSPRQEELAQQICMEIAGKRGEPACPPDPVRLLEMAEKLYWAEWDDIGSEQMFPFDPGQQPPAEMALVPIEPTGEMRSKAMEMLIDSGNIYERDGQIVIETYVTRQFWATMLAAAPKGIKSSCPEIPEDCLDTAPMAGSEPLTEQQIASACLSYHHGFGLMTEIEKSLLMRVARDWERALSRAATQGIQQARKAPSCPTT